VLDRIAMGDGTTATPEPLHTRLARVLREAGGTILFGLPGGGPNLDVVGAAEAEGLRFVLAHAETEAAIMAATYGLLTGSPAAVVATRGPGAASLANGAAQATLDRFPLVAVTDTVPVAQRERVAHQRIDQRALLAPVSKVSATIGADTPTGRLADLVAAAGRWPYGTVHLDYDPSAPEPPGAAPPGPDPAGPHATGPAPDAIAAARAVLAGTTRPLVLVGVEAAVQADRIRPLLEQAGCPVLTTYQAVGVVPTEGGLHAGLFTNGALETPVLDAADVVVAVGLDAVEPIPAPWRSPVPVIRLSAVPERDPYLPATAEVVGDLAASLAALGLDGSGWPADAAAGLREAARAVIRRCEPTTGGLGPVTVVDVVARHAPPLLTVTVDAGAHFLAVMPVWPVDRAHRLLISNGLATMGFAVPAAIGAALARPGEPVLAFVGDGGLSMTLAELETLARLQLPVTVVVFNDAALSLIEIKQQATHGGSEVVRYRPVDFAATARAAGVAGDVVDSADQLAWLLSGGWERPRLVDVRFDPSAYRALIAATRG